MHHLRVGWQSTDTLSHTCITREALKASLWASTKSKMKQRKTTTAETAGRKWGEEKQNTRVHNGRKVWKQFRNLFASVLVCLAGVWWLCLQGSPMDNSSHVSMGTHMMLSCCWIAAKLLQRSPAWNICMMLCCHGGWKVEMRRKRPLFKNVPPYVVSSVPWSADCVWNVLLSIPAVVFWQVYPRV